MANLLRSAKSGKGWSAIELAAYNISIFTLNSESFFGKPLPTDLVGIDPLLLTTDARTERLSDETLSFLQYLNLATKPHRGQDSATIDFANELLVLLGYRERGLLLRSRYTTPFCICGDNNQSTQADICLVQGSSTILLVLQTALGERDPEPDIIANAIAAFQLNNRARARLGLPELDSMDIPCISFTISTRPTFYLVPVTQDLNSAVKSGIYPSTKTIVKKCVVASGSLRINEGMETPDFRRLAFRHFVLFRELAKERWTEYTV